MIIRPKACERAIGQQHMAIEFTGHAEAKFEILERHGVVVEKALVEKAISSPERVDTGYGGRKIAQIGMDERHVLRVVYEEHEGRIVVITFYPGRRSRYEDRLR